MLVQALLEQTYLKMNVNGVILTRDLLGPQMKVD